MHGIKRERLLVIKLLDNHEWICKKIIKKTQQN